MDFYTHETQRLQAIGQVDGGNEQVKRVLDPSGFEPLPKPDPEDWLSANPEPGQSFEQFEKGRKRVPTQHRKTVYLQLLGTYEQGQGPCLDVLQRFASSFFSMSVQVIPPIKQVQRFTTRRNPFSGKVQVLSTDVLDFLRTKKPEDAFCILGITMEDLYPHPSWNFVFGQASLLEGVGVFSFARYDPAFYKVPRDQRGGDARITLLYRSMKVLAHETGHMFSISHCIFFRCIMNGSNHLQETDRRPVFLCPVCLRKLQSSIGFDYAHRYEELLLFFREQGYTEQAGWLQRRLEYIRG